MRITQRRAVAILAIVLTFCSLPLLADDYWLKVADPEAPRKMVPLDGFEDGPEVGVIVEVNDWRSLARLETDIRNIEGRGGTRRPAANAARERILEHQYKLALTGASARVSRESVNAIRALPYVKAVHPDVKVEAHLVNSVPAINAPQVWEQYNVRGRGIVIAIIDTGIDYNHRALGRGFGLGKKVIGGWDFHNNDADPMDDYGHGTHVAGIAAGNSAPVIGVAPEASLLAYKVLDEQGRGLISNIIAAVERVLDPNGDGDFSDRPHIVNMSLGGPARWNDPLVTAVERAVEAGIVMVVSAGNTPANGAIGTPGAAPSAITVGATDAEHPAFFTSRGPLGKTWAAKPELAAPGYNITSSMLGNRTISASGTSMAAPHVAGAAALIREKHPTWTPADVKAALVSSAKPIFSEAEPGLAVVLSAGTGRIDVKRAIESTILPSPANVSFGMLMKRGEPFTATRTVRLTNRGSEAETLTFKAPALPKGATLTISPETVTIEKDSTAEVALTLKFDAAAPLSNEDNLALTGQLELGGTKTSLRLAWLAINGHALHATFPGEDKVSVLVAARRGDPAIWETGPRSFGVFLQEEDMDVVTYFEPENADPRLVLHEKVPLTGYRDVTVSPSDAIYKIDTASTDERGVPFATYAGPGTNTSVSVVRDIVLKEGWQLINFSAGDHDRNLWVSPIKHAWLRIAQTFVTPDAVYATMLPIVKSVSDHVTVGARATDWAGQTISYQCATKCKTSITAGGGAWRIHPRFEVGEGSDSWKLFLTPRVDEMWDFRAHVMVREEGVPAEWEPGGVNPWTYQTSSLRNHGGKFTVSPFNRMTAVDYLPGEQQPLAIGDALPLLRTIQGTRLLKFEPFDAGLGGLFGDAARGIKARLWDSTGAAVLLPERLNRGEYDLPRTQSGVYRIEATMDYKIAGRSGRMTQTSSYEFEKHFAAPTLSMLRIEDGGGNVTNTLARNARGRLVLAARHSTLNDNWYVFHYKIAPEATRVSWRPHGTTEWLPLPVSVIGEDYSHRGELPGTAGTLHAADLQSLTSMTGAIDLKVHVATRFNGATEVVYEPAVIVTEAGPRRRAVR
jgi:Subtilase family